MESSQLKNYHVPSNSMLLSYQKKSNLLSGSNLSPQLHSSNLINPLLQNSQSLNSKYSSLLSPGITSKNNASSKLETSKPLENKLLTSTKTAFSVLPKKENEKICLTSRSNLLPLSNTERCSMGLKLTDSRAMPSSSLLLNTNLKLKSSLLSDKTGKSKLDSHLTTKSNQKLIEIDEREVLEDEEIFEPFKPANVFENLPPSFASIEFDTSDSDSDSYDGGSTTSAEASVTSANIAVRTELTNSESEKQNQISVKIKFVCMVSGSLINSPNFKDQTDVTRKALINAADDVTNIDPEFILKCALYSRRELNIRTTSNFLLAYASNKVDCRPYLKKYFNMSINLPSDWIEVAELYQSIGDWSINFGALPSALRKVLASKFSEFDEYQLAKYNKEKKNPAKKPAITKDKEDSSDDEENEEKIKLRSFTLKQLIRQLHINCPVQFVMSILGKKYPFTPEEFLKSRLPGVFDSDLAGKRMKLQTPLTWETQISLRGNKAEVWEELIDKRKLPYMAMLRNIRNMIYAGISEKHHTFVIKKIQDEGAVINSKQFPFRFFSAYQVLDELYKQIADRNESGDKELEKALKIVAAFNKRVSKFKKKGNLASGSSLKQSGVVKAAKRRLNEPRKQSSPNKSLDPTDPKADEAQPLWKKKLAMKHLENLQKPLAFDTNLLDRYRSALDEAVKIATVHNVPPIRGKTLLLTGSAHSTTACKTFKGMGQSRSIGQVSMLMSLMCKFACESCEMFVFYDNAYLSVREVDPQVGILKHMDKLVGEKPEGIKSTKSNEQSLDEVLQSVLEIRQKFDNIILVGLPEDKLVRKFLPIYRSIVNRNAMVFQLDLAGFKKEITDSVDNPNWIRVAGFSDQLLRYISERGDAALLNRIEEIDERFRLETNLQTAIDQTILKNRWLSGFDSSDSATPAKQMKLWRPVRVFISSTFRDMHGERDVLTRLVFPELRQRLKEFGIHVEEIDLRWGITESATKSGKSLEICLNEVNKADFFVGIYGERYGWVPGPLLTENLSPEIKEKLGARCSSMSITEMELMLALPRLQKQTFLYCRDPICVKSIPSSFMNDFTETSPELKEKMEKFKKGLYKLEVFVLKNYPAEFAADIDGKPILGNLEKFANNVLSSLYRSIESWNSKCGLNESSKEEEYSKSMTHFIERENDRFKGRAREFRDVLKLLKTDLKLLGTRLDRNDADQEVKEATKTVSVKIPGHSPKPRVTYGRGGVLLLTGPPGCGKTGLTANLASHLSKHTENSSTVDSFPLAHFVGACPGSEDIRCVLSYWVRSVLALLGGNQCEDMDQGNEDLGSLIQMFSDSIQKCAKFNVPVTFLIDGVDLLCNIGNARSCDWIPGKLPKCIRFVVSAVEGGDAHRSISKREDFIQYSLTTMNVVERSHVIRDILAQHGKSLQESGFNNEMKLLTGKKDSGLPLYLNLACEELRLHGVYEKLSEKLRSLPPKLSMLIDHMLDRVEAECGKELVKICLCFLICIKEDISLMDLTSCVNIWFSIPTVQAAANSDAPSYVPSTKEIIDSINSDKESHIVPPLTFRRLLASFKGLIVRKQADMESGVSECIHLSHPDTVKALRNRYLKQGLFSLESAIHCVLALRWKNIADPDKNFTFSQNYKPSLKHLTYHLFHAGEWTVLQKTMTSIHYLNKKLILDMAETLIDDYLRPDTGNKSLIPQWEKIRNTKEVNDYASFVVKNIPFLSKFPHLMCQQALNENPCSQVRTDSKLHLKQLICREQEECFILERVNREMSLHPDKSTEDLQLGVNDSSRHPTTAVAYSLDGKMIAAGSKNGVIRLFDGETFKEVTSFLGHSGQITGLTFLGGDGRRLCSVCEDGSSCLWSSRVAHRIQYLTKHSKACTGCAASPRGDLLITISLGGYAFLFEGGQETVTESYKFNMRRPLNCVCFHPEGSKFAVASWDNTISMFNVHSRKRIAVNRKHGSAVRSITFSRDGCHLISGTIDGEVFVWHANTGSFVGLIQPKGTPVTQLAYSQSGSELVVADENGLNVWSGNLGVLKFEVLVKKNGSASALDYHDGRALLAVGFHNGELSIVDPASQTVLTSADKPHTARIREVKWMTLENTEEFHLMTAAEDKNIVIWLYKNNKLIRKNKLTVESPILSLDVKKSVYLAGCEDCSTLISKINSQSPLQLAEPNILCHNSGAVTAVSIEETEKFGATGSKDMSITVIDLNSQSVLCSFPQAHADWITALSWRHTLGVDVSPGETGQLVSASNDNRLTIWRFVNVVKPDLVRVTEIAGAKSALTCVDFKLGLIASGSLSGEVQLWSSQGVLLTNLYGGFGDTSKVHACYLEIDRSVVSSCKGLLRSNSSKKDPPGASWAEMEEVEELKKASKNPQNDRIILMTMLSQAVRVFGARESGGIVGHAALQSNLIGRISGHSDMVTSVATGLNRQLVSSSLDCSLRLWKLPRTNDCGELQFHQDRVTCMAFDEFFSDPDKTTFPYFVTGASDGSLLLWKRPKSFEMEGRTKFAHAKLLSPVVMSHNCSSPLPITDVAVFHSKKKHPCLLVLCHKYLYKIEYNWEKLAAGVIINIRDLNCQCEVLPAPGSRMHIITYRNIEQVIVFLSSTEHKNPNYYFLPERGTGELTQENGERFSDNEMDCGYYFDLSYETHAAMFIRDVQYGTVTKLFNTFNDKKLKFNIQKVSLDCGEITSFCDGNYTDYLILSASRDGNLKFFDQSSDLQYEMKVGKAISSACFILYPSSDYSFHKSPCVVIGYENGLLEIWKLSGMKKIGMYQLDSQPVLMKTYRDEELANYLIIGDIQGNVTFLLLHF